MEIWLVFKRNESGLRILLDAFTDKRGAHEFYNEARETNKLCECMCLSEYRSLTFKAPTEDKKIVVKIDFSEAAAKKSLFQIAARAADYFAEILADYAYRAEWLGIYSMSYDDISEVNMTGAVMVRKYGINTLKGDEFSADFITAQKYPADITRALFALEELSRGRIMSAYTKLNVAIPPDSGLPFPNFKYLRFHGDEDGKLFLREFRAFLPKIEIYEKKVLTQNL